MSTSFKIQYPDGGEMVTTEDAQILYRGDGAPISYIGKKGIFIAKQEERIFDMDIILRYKYFTKEEIEKTMSEVINK